MRSFDRDQQAVAFLIGLLIIMGYCVRPFSGLLSFLQDKTGAEQGEQVREVFIEVQGMAKRPGVYSFDKNPSCVEAIQEGGGIAGGLVLESLSAAMPILEKGDRLTVVKKNPDEAGIIIAEMDAARQVALGIPLDINSADSERLDVLPGVGRHLAERIIRFRKEHGPIKTPEDILKVRGIGKKKLEQLKPYITIKNFNREYKPH